MGFCSNKKGVSEIVATVIILLITISAIFMVFAFIIPFVKDNLTKGSKCFPSALEEVSIVDESSCYNLNTEINTLIRVKFGNIESDVKGIYITLDVGQEVISYTLKQGESYPNINNGAMVNMPSKDGGERTYIFNGVSSREAGIGIIDKETRCKLSDEAELTKCKT